MARGVELAALLAPVPMVAVTVVEGERSAAGVKVAVMPAYLTVPETAVAPCFTVKVAALMVVGSIASLNVALMVLLTPTFVAASAGSVEETVGAGAGLGNSTSCWPQAARNERSRTRTLLFRALIGCSLLPSK